MNNLTLKRPKRINDEDEDDLLAFQEQFLKSKNNEQPSAKCVRQYSDETKKNEDKKESVKENIPEDMDCMCCSIHITIHIITPSPLNNHFHFII